MVASADSYFLRREGCGYRALSRPVSCGVRAAKRCAAGKQERSTAHSGTGPQGRTNLFGSALCHD